MKIPGFFNAPEKHCVNGIDKKRKTVDIFALKKFTRSSKISDIYIFLLDLLTLIEELLRTRIADRYSNVRNRKNRMKSMFQQICTKTEKT